MSRSAPFQAGLLALLALAVAAPAAAQPGNKDVVTVAFGRGMNTNQPGNPANHHILPDVIKVKQGGVVNFVVSGFHQIVVYLPGRDRDDLVVPAAGLFVDDGAGTYYVGPAPNGPPPPGSGFGVTPGPAPGAPVLAMNRVEPVSFDVPGRYLVICNIRPHLLDGMWAIVEVEPGGF
jgi:hypothetical protein